MVNVDMIYESLSACAASSTSADTDADNALLQRSHSIVKDATEKQQAEHPNTALNHQG